MTLISSNIKTNIVKKLYEIINIPDLEWKNLCIDLKLKIVHNLCNSIKKNNHVESTQHHLNLSKDLLYDQIINTQMFIPLKNQRPKKIIELCGINKQENSKLFNEFRKNMIDLNREFRKVYNSKNRTYCFANLSKVNYDSILNDYNFKIYDFINSNINIIDHDNLYKNILMGNNHKIITNSHSNIRISKISYIEKFINIEFNNNISIKLELYFTSEKITSNIPAKYSIFLINIF